MEGGNGYRRWREEGPIHKTQEDKNMFEAPAIADNVADVIDVY